MIDSIIDLLMFRQGGDSDNHTNEPVVTMGSVVWGVLFRTVIISLVWIYALYEFDLFDNWWVGLFLIWLLALFPGYNQYKTFEKRIAKLGESTLCGTCRHYRPQGQLCQIYDEHVSLDHIPCEGSAWEPAPSYDDGED